MNAWWAAALAGAVCGLLSGLGIGGGTLLMVWMTGVAALPQQTAQGINLLYFLPSAACALFFHIRNRLIRWDIVLPAALGGCVTAAIAAWIATGLDVSLLRRLFGGFLCRFGIDVSVEGVHAVAGAGFRTFDEGHGHAACVGEHDAFGLREVVRRIGLERFFGIVKVGGQSRA